MPKGILNKASLVMVPEAPIDGTMPSVFPEDRSGDFTFTRGSNLAATRVASNGLIEKGRENLLLQSNQFDTTWLQVNTTLTSGQSGYDGSSNAWKIEAASTGTIRLRQLKNISANSVITMSVYAKIGNVDFIKFNLLTSGTNSIVTFDLTDGTTYSSNAIDEKWESVGNGWVRISATFTNSLQITEQRIEVRSEYDLLSAPAGSFVYIQDAQVEVGLAATSYIESGATTGKAGLLENEPRIDFTGGGCGSLLLEPQRTNLVTQSEYFGAWNEQRIASVTNNQAVSPEGVQNAALLDLGATSGGFNRIDIDASISAGTDYVFSVFVKNIDVDNISISNFETGNYLNATFDLVNGIKYSSSTSYIEDYGNDWWRVSLVFSTNTATTASLRIQPSLNGSYPSQGEQFYIYGATLELGSYPTSYIPTYGSSVTRSNDEGNLNLLVSKNIIQSDTLTYFIELNTESLVRDSSLRIINLGSTNNEFFIYNNSLSESRPVLYISSSTGQSTYLLPQDNLKLCIRIQPSGTQVFVNGSQVLNTTNAPEFSANSYYSFRGTNRKALFKQKAFFPTALTDEECSALTQP